METVIRNTIAVIVFSIVTSLAHGKIIDTAKNGYTVKEINGGLPPQQELLQKHLNRLYAIEKKGGWQQIQTTRRYYQIHQSAPAIKQIKKRLQASGDLDIEDQSDLFTKELEEAVKKVQKRFGYKENGVVDAQLIKELNVPVEKRIEQLLVNMDRLSDQQQTSGTRLVANIPEFTLHVYEDGRHVFDMDIVVGTSSNRTVVFNDEMTSIVFSPYWNVPPSIVENEILPAMQKSPGYLSRNGYEQVGTENGLPVIRQKPGAKNSLGRVKFVFPNSHAIYFHDTPAQSLFQLRKRTFSHGCIRLAEPAKLARYLLKNVPGWSPAKIDKAMYSGKEQTVALPVPVAVAITYTTAWVDAEGQLNLREDIYGLDAQQAKQIVKR